MQENLAGHTKFTPVGPAPPDIPGLAVRMTS
jgi:hypothetical protein